MSKLKGPKDGVLKLHFNGSNKTMPGDQQAVMLLSIRNNEQCEGEYLALALRQATDIDSKDSKFSSLTVLIADELYWHNLAKSVEDSVANKEQLKIEALRLGEKFFQTNLLAFLSPFDTEKRNTLLSECENKTADEQISIINQAAAKLTIPFKIMRWATWVNQKTRKGLPYKDIQKSLEDLYQTQPHLIAGIKRTADDFAKRHTGEADLEVLRHRSEGYLKEESPAVMWLAAELGYNFIIYAGKIISSFSATKDYFIVDSKNQELAKGPFAIAVENPNNLVNWLNAYYRLVPAPKVAEKPTPAEALPAVSIKPVNEITPDLALSVLTPYTDINFSLLMFPPSPRKRRESKPLSEKNTLKRPDEAPSKKTTFLEDQFDPLMRSAIKKIKKSIEETLAALPTEKQQSDLIAFVRSSLFVDLCASKKKEILSQEISTQLRMS